MICISIYDLKDLYKDKNIDIIALVNIREKLRIEPTQLEQSKRLFAPKDLERMIEEYNSTVNTEKREKLPIKRLKKFY